MVVKQETQETSRGYSCSESTVFRSNRNTRETEGYKCIVFQPCSEVHGNTTDIKGLLVHSTCIKTVCSEVHLYTTEPESLTGVIAKPKQNRKRVEPDDATVTVLVVDGRGQQDIRECTADEDQP